MSGDADGIDLLIREPAAEPAGALILNHGRGSDERDLFGLIDALDPGRRMLAVSTGAPIRDLPPGGRHWYVVERVGFPHEETFKRSYGALADRLDGLLAERGLGWDRVAIGGFSQGAVMSYALALGAGRPTPAALLALSGFIPRVSGWELEPARRDGLRVYIHHGAGDPVISVEFAREAERRLAQLGIPVTYRETMAGHELPPEIIPELERHLAASLGAPGTETISTAARDDAADG